jgi:Fe-S cluster assembly protein SufD
VSVDVRQQYRDDFRRLEGELPGRAVPWLHALRTEALDRFLQNGFPTSRDEDWKYTDVRAIGAKHFAPAQRVQLVPAEILPLDLDAYTLVFVDGFFAMTLAGSATLPAGVQVMNLARAMAGDADALEPWLTRKAAPERHGFDALNLALTQDGAYVRIEADASIERPLHLLFVTTAKPASGIYLRNLIVAERGSHATVVESYVALAEADYLTDVVTDVVLGPGTTLDHYRLEREAGDAFHIGSTRVRQERDSHYRSHSITLGGRIARHELSCQLEATGARASLNGLYIGNQRQHMDHHTRIEHRAAHGTSREWYRGIVTDAARGIFSGRVVVHPQARHTDAEQENHNLVLSARAEADSRPQFEINVDDVKCAHGSSTGRLDPDALFYLRTRGLDEPRARELLVYAFAADVLERMRLAPVRALVEEQLSQRLLAGRRIEELLQ